MRDHRSTRTVTLIVAVSMFLALSCGGNKETPCSPTDPSCGGAPATSSLTLNVPYIPQQTQLWCWAATSEMIFRYYGEPIAQCQLVSVYTTLNCCAGAPGCIVSAGNMQIIQNGLAIYGIRSVLVNGTLTFDQIAQEINAGRPVMIGYLGSFAGHVVLIVGYDRIAGTIRIYDPNYGPVVVPYGASFVYGGQLTWYQTLVGISG